MELLAIDEKWERRFILEDGTPLFRVEVIFFVHSHTNSDVASTNSKHELATVTLLLSQHLHFYRR
jgi:hypothetical protein